MPPKISLHAALRFAWTAYKQHFQLFAAMLVAVLGGWVALEILAFTASQMGIIGIIISVVAHLAFGVFYAGMMAGLLRMCLTIRRGEQPTLAEGFGSFDLGPRLMVAGLAYLLAVTLGLVLLVVPGVFVASRWLFYPFPIVSERAGIMVGFKRAADVTNGALPGAAMLFGAIIVLNLVGACVVGLGLLVTIPMSMLMLTDAWKQRTTGAAAMKRAA
jgi:hypothetical protein